MKNFNESFNRIIKENPAPAPVKPTTKPAPTKTPGPSRPHPLTPSKPGVSPRPNALAKEKAPADSEVQSFINKRKHR